MAGLQKLLAWGKTQQIQLIVDESFVDFSDDFEHNTLLRNETLADNPQLVVMKSISKSYGVPGLRLGILASSDVALIKWIKKDISIWNINSFAEFYMQIFGKYESDYLAALLPVVSLLLSADVLRCCSGRYLICACCRRRLTTSA